MFNSLSTKIFHYITEPELRKLELQNTKKIPDALWEIYALWKMGQNIEIRMQKFQSN